MDIQELDRQLDSMVDTILAKCSESEVATIESAMVVIIENMSGLHDRARHVETWRDALKRGRRRRSAAS
jgi:hypothetical protein